MKYKISCDSLLLEKALKNFLKDYLSEDGIVITDRNEKNSIVIGKHIKKPFTKSQLLLTLSNLDSIKFQKEPQQPLEVKIEKLTQKFVKELIDIIKENK
jgi:hypothetical protein